MTKGLRDLRLVPVLLIAIGALFLLKTSGVLLGGGYSLGQRMAANENTITVTTVPVAPVAQIKSPAVALEFPSDAPKKSWMQDVFNYPGGADITGSVKAAPKPAEKPPEPAEKPAEMTPESKAAMGTPVAIEERRPSAGEKALLERLQERRQELDARARELDMRETMVKASEQKQGGGADGKPGQPAQRKDAAKDAKEEEAENPRFKHLVTMYETMKPKDAAKIFDRLDIKVLTEVAGQIKPQRMSEILAQMSPEAAERLTIEFATKPGTDRTLNASTLPKIEGKPTN